MGEDDTYIGKATLTVEVPEQGQMAALQIDRLNKLLEAARAEAQKRENAILDRISKLQALTYSEAT